MSSLAGSTGEPRLQIKISTFKHHKILLINGVGTNFGVGVEEARPEGPRAGMGFLERGQPAHPHQLGGLLERCKLPRRGPGPPKGFLVF